MSPTIKNGSQATQKLFLRPKVVNKAQVEFFFNLKKTHKLL